ncbi:MAG: clpS [Rickettsiales bacterium]|jgi:ATP-dependent Clp protease adaptor protein ClpS|nr:clpS [Rickettsiales bacterium]
MSGGNNEFQFEWEQPDGNEMFFYLSEEALFPSEEKGPFTPPPMYQILLLNDDTTPMEFVTHILETVFHYPSITAADVTLSIHENDKALCGRYTRDVAETIVAQIHELARSYDHPLQCLVQREAAYALKKS